MAMKSTGIVRRVDELGRVVIPIELRRVLEIEDREPIEIFVDGEMIILRKYQPSCVFCSSVEGVVNFKGKNVCDDCLESIAADHKAS